MRNKQSWNHTRTCDYCSTHEQMADQHYANGQSGCRHYRGGKTASDSGKRWPKLERK